MNAKSAETAEKDGAVRERVHFAEADFADEAMPQEQFDALLASISDGDTNHLAGYIRTVVFWRATALEPSGGGGDPVNVGIERDDAVVHLKEVAASVNREQFRILVTHGLRDVEPVFADDTVSTGDEVFAYSFDNPRASIDEIGEAFERSSRNTTHRYLRIGALRAGRLPEPDSAITYDHPFVTEIVAEMVVGGIVDAKVDGTERLDVLAVFRDLVDERAREKGMRVTGNLRDCRFSDLLLRHADYLHKTRAPRSGKTALIGDLRTAMEGVKGDGDYIRQAEYNDFWSQHDYTADDGHTVLTSNAISRHCRWSDVTTVAKDGVAALRSGLDAALDEIRELAEALDVDATGVNFSLANKAPNRYRRRVIDAISVLSLADPAEAMMPYGAAEPLSDLHAELVEVWGNRSGSGKSR